MNDIEFSCVGSGRPATPKDQEEIRGNWEGGLYWLPESIDLLPQNYQPSKKKHSLRSRIGIH
jgi:hypothetical protein